MIRVKIKGEKTQTIIHKVNRLVTDIGWELVTKRVITRIERIERIGQCPIIYIGSAGTQPSSKHRYKEFSSRHTIMYPIIDLFVEADGNQVGLEVACRRVLRDSQQEDTPPPALLHQHIKTKQGEESHVQSR